MTIIRNKRKSAKISGNQNGINQDKLNLPDDIKTVLITGGAGYVGAVLVPKLLNSGYRVKVLDWFIYGDVLNEFSNNKHLIQIKGSLSDKKLVEKSLHNVDAVVHLACISNDPSFELDPKLGKSVNYDATCQLFDLVIKAGVKRFIYASSSSVYGIKSQTKVTEDLSLEPLTDYSKYKALCEKYILNRKNPLITCIILRPATVCGYSPRLRLDLTVNLLTLQALYKGKITVFGGSQYRPNIHIEDMTDLYVKTLTYPKEKISGKIYNAGYENYSLLEIANMIKKVIGRKNLQIKIVPTNDLRSYRVCSDKIYKELGFKPVHSVEDAITDLVRAYKSGKIPNPDSDNRYFNIKTMKQIKIINE